MAYIGSSASPLPVNFAAVQAQSFNGTGSQTAFTLSRTVSSVTSIEVLVNNVQQSPYDGSYNIAGGTSLVFSEAPSSGTNNVYVVYRDQSLGSLVDTTAYRKAEVDSAVAGKVNKAGDTMTGTLQVPQLNIGSRKQFDLANLGDETSINWDAVTKNSISYALGSSHTNAPLQGVNSMVVDLNTEGMGGTHDSGADTRGVQLWFTDTSGSQQGGTNGRFAIRPKQGVTWHPWEKVLTTYSFRRGFVRQTSTMMTSTSTYQDIPGVSISVTPISVNSRFLLFARWGGYWNPSGDAKGRILRDGTQILENQRIAGNSTTQHETCTEVWIDHPNTTSSVTYKLQGAVVTSGSGSMDFGHGDNLCSILVMEFEGA